MTWRAHLLAALVAVSAADVLTTLAIIAHGAERSPLAAVVVAGGPWAMGAVKAVALVVLATILLHRPSVGTAVCVGLLVMTGAAVVNNAQLAQRVAGF